MIDEGRSDYTGERSFVTSSLDDDARSCSGDGQYEVYDGEEDDLRGLGRRRRNTDDGASTADTDASIRPISPSSLAPSSIISVPASTASYAPTHRTYKSTASTKPTTFSMESSGGNRIAVVTATGGMIPASNSVGSNGTSVSPSRRLAAPASEGPAITFSDLPSTSPAAGPSSIFAGSNIDNNSTMNAPRHTLAHPRNNPHPASPPPDNASMLTLASSSFAPSLSHQSRSYSRSLIGFSGIRQSNLSIGGGNEADEDASVRALAPSRRASDESLGSRSTWSAAVLSNKKGTGKTESIRTMDTSDRASHHLDEEDTSHQDLAGEMCEIRDGYETEAQKVARTEGGGREVSLGARHPVVPDESLEFVVSDATSSTSTPSESELQSVTAPATISTVRPQLHVVPDNSTLIMSDQPMTPPSPSLDSAITVSGYAVS